VGIVDDIMSCSKVDQHYMKKSLGTKYKINVKSCKILAVSYNYVYNSMTFQFTHSITC